MNKKRSKKELQTEYEFVLGKLDAAFVTITELKETVMELEKGQCKGAEEPKFSKEQKEEILAKFANKMGKSEDFPSEYQKVLDDNFWDLVSTAPEPKFSRVKPKQCVDYYYIDGISEISNTEWLGHNVDKTRWSIGNVYLTRKAAELARDRQQAKVRVIDKLAELKDVELDWSNDVQDKFHMGVSANGRISIDYNIRMIVQEKELYSTKEACEWVAENMADDVRLYLTGE